MPDDKKIFALDLTKRPPRSPRLRLDGYALLPRMLDKGIAAPAMMGLNKIQKNG